MTKSAELPATLMVLFFSTCAALGCAAEDEPRPEFHKGSAQAGPLEKDESESGASKGAADEDAKGEEAPGEASDEPQLRVCDEAAQRSCSVETLLASGVRSCWKGVQFCVGGAWSQCYPLD